MKLCWQLGHRKTRQSTGARSGKCCRLSPGDRGRVFCELAQENGENSIRAALIAAAGQLANPSAPLARPDLWCIPSSLTNDPWGVRWPRLPAVHRLDQPAEIGSCNGCRSNGMAPSAEVASWQG